MLHAPPEALRQASLAQAGGGDYALHLLRCIGVYVVGAKSGRGSVGVVGAKSGRGSVGWAPQGTRLRRKQRAQECVGNGGAALGLSDTAAHEYFSLCLYGAEAQSHDL